MSSWFDDDGFDPLAVPHILFVCVRFCSIIGGRTYGVAKGVTIHDVRIRDHNNTLRWAHLYAGFDYVVAERRRFPDRKLLINVSYSGTCFVNVLNLKPH